MPVIAPIVGVIASIATTAFTVVKSVVGFLGKVFAFTLEGAFTLIKAVGEGLLKVKDFGKLLAQRAWNGLRAIGRYLRPIYDHFLKPLLRVLHIILNKVVTIVDGILKPILLAFSCLNLILDLIHTRLLRPIAEQFFRIHQVFRVIGVFWPSLGRKLDKRLARSEHIIFGGFLTVRRKINEHDLFVNRLLTLDGLLQGRTLWASVIRDLHLLYGIFYGGHLSDPRKIFAILREHETRARDLPALRSEIRTFGALSPAARRAALAPPLAPIGS